MTWWKVLKQSKIIGGNEMHPRDLMLSPRPSVVTGVKYYFWQMWSQTIGQTNLFQFVPVVREAGQVRIYNSQHSWWFKSQPEFCFFQLFDGVVWWEKCRPWQDSNLQSPAPETDAFSIRPHGRCTVNIQFLPLTKLISIRIATLFTDHSVWQHSCAVGSNYK